MANYTKSDQRADAMRAEIAKAVIVSHLSGTHFQYSSLLAVRHDYLTFIAVGKREMSLIEAFPRDDVADVGSAARPIATTVQMEKINRQIQVAAG